ncbi:MAG: hypothetical protein KGK03_00755 [Candidatus Omnitrophica bacterium]|nr:hypothetical protein [Candidatus Omnitrophota bacterium]MDE2221584.1 hypothetical protein [Candidatus Omnitrophota bacterium]
MKRIIIYYSHRQTLGHQSRVANIVASLHTNYKKKVKVFLFNAGLPEEFIQFPPGTVCINIPFPFHSKQDFRVDRKNFSRGDVSSRSQFMLKQIEKIRPDVFITEFFPFGRPDLIEEIFPVLRLVHSRGAKIISSLGYPYINPFFFKTESRKIYTLLAKFYETILVHTPDGLEEAYALKSLGDAQNEHPKGGLTKSYTDAFSVVKDKIVHTGYIVPAGIKNVSRPVLVNKIKSRERIFVLVSRGGGVIYPKLLTSAIQAKRILGDKFVFLIVPGPSSTGAEMALFRSLIDKAGPEGIEMRPYVPDLFKYIRFCDVSISMCGYNTSAELLFFRTKSIVVPWRLWENQDNSYYNDQLTRSYLLKEYLGSGVVQYNSISAKALADGVQEQMAKDPPKEILKASDFEGAYFTAARIMS